MATTTPQGIWEDLAANLPARGTRERAALNMAERNADDTSVERNFALFSADWYEIFASSYEYALDTMTDDQVEDWSFV